MTTQHEPRRLRTLGIVFLIAAAAFMAVGSMVNPVFLTIAPAFAAVGVVFVAKSRPAAQP
ncbi:MAG: hypothetical protein Q4G62_10815 [Pseudomonadota bacterium]|nr:hypothetical protein [Pseudomonadota bacterium]